MSAMGETIHFRPKPTPAPPKKRGGFFSRRRNEDARIELELAQRHEMLCLLRQIEEHTRKLSKAVSSRGQGGFETYYLKVSDKY